jgi:hypothetical protein
MSVIPEGHVRHILTHWQIITLHVAVGEQSQASPRLVGRVLGTGQSWATSHVVGVDLSNGLVRTSNSTYRIQGSQVSENELDLVHICAALNSWGLGQFLGVPEFFY